MSAAETLLTLGILLALGRAAPRIFLCARLWRTGLRAPSFEPVAPAFLPASLDPIFELADAALSAHGFEALGARLEIPVERDAAGRPQRVYAHRPTGTLAVVEAPRRGSGGRPLQARFVTRRADGSVLATFDGVEHLTLGFPTDWECEDLDAGGDLEGPDADGDLEKQWTAHRGRLGPDVAPGPAPHAFEELARLEARAWRRTLEAWERAGLTARRAGDATGWRLRLAGAWRLAGRVLEGRRRMSAREGRQARARARLPLWQRDEEGGVPRRDGATEAARVAGMAWRLERDRRVRRRRGGRLRRRIDRARRRAGRHPSLPQPTGAGLALLVGVALALVAAAWSARSPLPAALAVALAMALPRRWRAARAAQRLRAELSDRAIAGRRRRAELAFSLFLDAPLDRIPTERRARLVDEVLTQLAPRPRRRRLISALAGGAVYLGLLVAIPLAARAWLEDRPPASAVAEPTSPATRPARAGPAPGVPPSAAAEAIVLSAPTPLRTLRPGGP